MISVLINAYACSPDMGSEPGMAWNWCVNLAKYCKLYIITEGEFRDKIERAVSALPQGGNMHFYYNPVPDTVRNMCWNQGDWRFYRYYRQWQRKTYLIAEEIIATTHIDVVHQLNMIGFREPGYLWKIEDIPFVWGPIGGLKQFPMEYAQGGGLRMRMFNLIKNTVNVLQLRYDSRVCTALQRADALVSSIPDSYNAIKKYHGLESVIIPETGCFDESVCAEYARDYDCRYMKIVWVGKFDFRKRLDIALAVIASVRNPFIVLQVYGSGNERQVKDAGEYSRRLDTGDYARIEWMGDCPNGRIQEAMREAHLFFFTSVSEDTSTVVMEAISNHLPVLCFDTCGMGYVVNDKVGIKIPLTNPRQSVRDFAEKIEYLYNNRDVLKQMSDNCAERRKELSWDNKARRMTGIYNSVIRQHGRKSPR